eukprot:762575-Hanusia_phi.AAC.3
MQANAAQSTNLRVAVAVCGTSWHAISSAGSPDQLHQVRSRIAMKLPWQTEVINMHKHQSFVSE